MALANLKTERFLWGVLSQVLAEVLPPGHVRYRS